MAAFDRLLTVMDELRENCPWDMKQTIASIRHLTIEETYELSDAILENDMEEVKKEIGDLMLHMIFYSRIASETNTFDVADVLHGICDKLVHRHPHIYGDVKVENEEEVKKNWEQLKLQEGKKSVFEGVPNALPSMVKAIRLQEKAKGIGFEWPDSSGALAKLEEELTEFKDTLKKDDLADREAEFGDLLFSMINVSRYFNINADNALEKTNQKFKSRFEYIEKRASELNKNIGEMTLDEMDVYWEEAKISLG